MVLYSARVGTHGNCRTIRRLDSGSAEKRRRGSGVHFRELEIGAPCTHFYRDA